MPKTFPLIAGSLIISNFFFLKSIIFNSLRPPTNSYDGFIVYNLNLLHNELLEKNLIKIIQPYSVVEISFITDSIGLQLTEILNKLSQMILDKKINGILDQGRGSLIIYDEIQSNVNFFDLGLFR